MASIYDLIKKYTYGMPGQVERGTGMTTGGTQGLLGSSGQYGQGGLLQQAISSPDVIQGLGLISAGMRGKGLQEALMDQEKINVLRAKSLGKPAGRYLTEQEVINKGYRPGSKVFLDPTTGKETVTFKPEAGELEKKATRGAVLSSINGLEKQIDKEGSGLIEGSVKIIGAGLGLDPKYARFRADTKGLELNVIKALRGAQVSAAEEENVKKILPSVFDTESVYKAKLASLKSYLKDVDTRIKGGVLTGEADFSKYEIKTPKKKDDPLGLF